MTSGEEVNCISAMALPGRLAAALQLDHRLDGVDLRADGLLWLANTRCHASVIAIEIPSKNTVKPCNRS